MKALALAALVAATSSAWAAPSDIGQFVITGALIDPAIDNAAQRYFHDDPRFVGRSVAIMAARVTFGADTCTQVRRSARNMTVTQLLAERLYRRASYQARHPRPVDMGLSRVPAGPVPVVTYTCLGPDDGKPGGIPGHVWTGAAAFPLGDGRIGLLWESETILLLTPAARVRSRGPSFDCRAAKSPAETAICRDGQLAAWDRSVARAYTLLRDGGGPDDVAAVEDPQGLIDSQRAWTAERDSCLADRACLIEHMAERTETLMERRW